MLPLAEAKFKSNLHKLIHPYMCLSAPAPVLESLLTPQQQLMQLQVAMYRY